MTINGAAGNDSNTVLLCHFNGNDGSTQAMDSSIGGDHGQATFEGATALIDTAQSKFGGSCLNLLAGTDYISFPDDADWAFAGDFTIDAWCRLDYVPTAGGEQSLIVSQYDGALDYWYFGVETLGAGPLLTIRLNDADIVITKTIPSMSTNTWYHLAVVRNGNNFHLFQDGVQLGTTGVDATAWEDKTSVLEIGGFNASGAYDGWIDELRISKVARWTAAFTPPSKAYRSFHNDPHTVLLLHCDGADGHTTWTDDSVGGTTHTPTSGNSAEGDTAEQKFGTASLMLTNATSDYLTVPDNDDWYLGDLNITIDFWVRIRSHDFAEIIGKPRIDSNDSWYLRFYFYSADGDDVGTYDLRLHGYSTGVSAPLSYYSDQFTMELDTWYHIAFIRGWDNDPENIGWTKDGTLISEDNTTAWPFPNNADAFIIGANLVGDRLYFDGWFDEIRVCKGIARWTANFLPPARKYADTPVSSFVVNGVEEPSKVMQISTGSISGISGVQPR